MNKRDSFNCQDQPLENEGCDVMDQARQGRAGAELRLKPEVKLSSRWRENKNCEVGRMSTPS